MKIETTNFEIPFLPAIKTTELKFSQAEVKVLKKAVDILDKAETMLTEYFRATGDYPDNWHLSDIDYDMADLFHGQYHIRDLLDTRVILE